MVLLGLVLLLAAVVIGVTGAATNAGQTHALAGGFDVFGYTFTGSAGALFVAGMVVGATGLLGLLLVIAGSRVSARKARAAKREVKRARREAAAAERARDRALHEQERVAATTSVVSNDATVAPGTRTGHPWSRWFGRRRAHTS